MSPNGPTVIKPKDIETSVVDGMHVVRLIKVTGLNTNTFKCWADRFVDYLKMFTGEILHLILDNYRV